MAWQTELAVALTGIGLMVLRATVRALLKGDVNVFNDQSLVPLGLGRWTIGTAVTSAGVSGFNQLIDVNGFTLFAVVSMGLWFSFYPACYLLRKSGRPGGRGPGPD